MALSGVSLVDLGFFAPDDLEAALVDKRTVQDIRRSERVSLNNTAVKLCTLVLE